MRLVNAQPDIHTLSEYLLAPHSSPTREARLLHRSVEASRLHMEAGFMSSSPRSGANAPLPSFLPKQRGHRRLETLHLTLLELSKHLLKLILPQFASLATVLKEQLGQQPGEVLQALRLLSILVPGAAF